MPNYQYVINSSFRPYSFQEMVAPLALYKDAYEKTEEAYNELQTKANVWEGMADETNDPNTYSQYKKYADDLRSQANDLANHGLNMQNRRQLMELRRRYASEIVPIEQAYTNRKMQADEQRKALLQNPTLMFSRMADRTSLDDYMKNPQLGYSSYSGALLTQQVGQAASAIAKELKEYGDGKPLNGFTKTWLQQHGYTASEVAQAINNPNSPNSNQILNAIVNNAVADSGIANWADPSTLKQAYSYARQGLWNAVGQNTIQTYTDEAAKIAAQEASQKRILNMQEAQQKANRPQIIPRALRSQQELKDNARLINTFVRNGYVKEVDGKYVLTPLGKKVYLMNVEVDEKSLPKGMDPKERGVALRGLETQKKQTDFRRFIDSLNGGKSVTNDRHEIMPTVIGNLFTKAVRNNNNDVYDMYHSTEYVRQLPPGEYQNAFKQQVMAEPEVLVKRDFNGKDGWKDEKISKSDLEKYKPVRFNYSKYGNTITWVNDKGEYIRTNAPKSVNESVDSETMRAFDYESIYSQILHKGKLPKTTWDYKQGKETIAVDKNGSVQFTDTPLTPRQIQAYTNDWYNIMDAIQSIGAMYVSPSSTKTREYGSYDFGSMSSVYNETDDSLEE